MRNAIAAALLVFAIVFMSGVIWGWFYGLLIGFTILLGVTLVNMGKKS